MNNVALESYNVVCMNCDQSFAPQIRSRLWWRAKKRSELGMLDALPISGGECGCVNIPPEQNAPYRIRGYDHFGRDFDIPFYRFIDAVLKFIGMNQDGYVVFLKGVSPAVISRIETMNFYEANLKP